MPDIAGNFCALILPNYVPGVEAAFICVVSLLASKREEVPVALVGYQDYRVILLKYHQ
jgi:hypothetical protein